MKILPFLIFILFYCCSTYDPSKKLIEMSDNPEEVKELDLSLSLAHDGILEYPDPIFQKSMKKINPVIGKFINLESLDLGNKVDPIVKTKMSYF